MSNDDKQNEHDGRVHDYKEYIKTQRKNGRFVKGNTIGFSSRPEAINRAGRPKRPSLTAALIRRLKEEEKTNGKLSNKNKRLIADELIDVAIEEAKNGSFKHFRELWVRLDGRGDMLGDMTHSHSKKRMTAEEHKDAAIELYRAVIDDSKSSIKDKLKAQDQLNLLLGLTEPQSTPVEAARAIQDAARLMLGASEAEPEEPDALPEEE